MSKKELNWQPIDKLPIFIALVEKMLHDTQQKLDKLNAAKKAIYSISDGELSEMMHVFHRQLDNHASLVGQFNRWLLDAKHLHERQLIKAILKRNEEVLRLTVECQDLGGSLIDQTIESKEDMMNHTGRSNKQNSSEEHKVRAQHELTNEMVTRYERIRKIRRDIFPKVVSHLDRDAVERSGARLEVMQGNSLLLNTEHESNVFFDYVYHTYKKNGLNAVQRSFNAYARQYDGEKLEVFKASKDAYFAYLEVVEPVGEAGLVVFDRVRNKEHLMIDHGLNKVSLMQPKYWIVTHIMEFDDFITSTGASTPVAIHTEEGMKVQRRFEQYLALHQSGSGNQKEVAQYITDMYKIILHEDITGQIDSPAAPFGEKALKARIGSSETVM